MNREIRFRGKRKDNSKWVYGGFMQTPEAVFIVDYSVVVQKPQDGYPTVYDVVEVGPETVGQFTGLKDKNGKEIYEGDIVRFEGYVGEFYEEGGREMLVGAVFYKTNGSVDYCFKVGCQNYGLNSNEISKYEVIGNIWENPELFQEKP